MSIRQCIRKWISICIVGVAWAAMSCVAQQPNVVLVLTDDQGFGDWSWNGKHPYLAGKTPNMEKMSNDGVFMTDFHTMPLCGPSRAALMSGNHAFYSRVWQGRHSMRADIPTIADVFKANGYTTGLYGKWHLGHGYPHSPEHRGFDDSIILGGGMFTTVEDYPSNNASTLSDLTLRHNGVMTQFSGYSTDLWFGKTMEFIEANQNNPFFVIVSTDAPHAPHVPPAKYTNEFDGVTFMNSDGSVADNQTTPAGFYGQIMGVDDGLGALRQKLADLNLDDNTIIMFMSDNGSTAAGKIYNGPADEGFNFYGWKAQNQEGGHRVPFFAYWKGHIEGGRRSDELTHIYDVLPTLVDLCGLSEIPSNANWDGHSMAEVLLGNSTLMPDQERVTYSSYATTYEPPAGLGGVMMYKDLRQFGNGALYDLTVDPQQQNNILGANRTPAQTAAATHMEESLQAVIDSYNADVFPFVDPRIVGTDIEPVVRLTCSDWNVKAPGFWMDLPNIYGASGSQVRFGNFLIKPIQAGTYRLSMFRWSPYANLSINDAAGPIGATHARLVIKEAGIDQTVALNGDPVSISFDVNLPRGMVEVDARFVDGNGDDLVSAYFLNVEKVADSGNLVPVAGIETYQSEANTVLSVPVPGVLANDSDAEGAAVSAILVQNAQNGSVVLNTDGSFVYTPNNNFYGKDSFSYKVNDGQQDGNTVPVELTIVMPGTVTKQLIGHWKLDETSGNTAVDSSGNGNNATLFNLPTSIITGEPGVIGTSFDFTYGPRLNLPSNSQMDLTNKDFSMAAWVKVRTPTTSGRDFRQIFGGDIGFHIDASGYPRLHSPLQPGESTKIVPANKSIPLNSWGHAVVTYDASEREVRYYVNGVPAGVDDWPNDFSGSLTWIGRERNYYGMYDGWLDDVRLYGEVLDAADAAALAIEGKSFINTPPISVPETYSTLKSRPLSIAAAGLLANDVDYDQDPIKTHLASFPLHGTIELNDDGSFVYTPDRNFFGVDMFNYRAQDAEESAKTVTVYIDVVDDGTVPPLAEILAPAHGAYLIVNEAATFSGRATDAEDGNLTGNSLVWSSSLDGEFGTGTNISVNSLSLGMHTIKLTATDSSGAVDVKSISVEVGPDPDTIPRNLALNGTATQSSDLWGSSRYAADKAIDGNTSGTFTYDDSNSVSHTGDDNQAWWQVDLGQLSTINSVNIYNRDYEKARLSNYYLFVSETAFTSTDPSVLASDPNVWSSYQTAEAGQPTTIDLGGIAGQFVRVQLTANTTALHMGEVEVIGIPGDSSSTGPYRLTYTASAGGSISGTATQVIEDGEDGTAVTAVADTDYMFVDWSDGSTENPRTDTDVSAHVTVTANFVSTTMTDGPVVGITGCVLWLDANDVDGDGAAEGLSEAGLSGSSVSTWADKSGENNNAVAASGKQAILTADALNGQPVVTFDGVDDTYTFNEISTAKTVFWVLREKERTETDDYHFFLGHPSNYGWHRGDEGHIWSSYTSGSITGGSTYLDGTEIDGQYTAFPLGQYKVLSMVTDGSAAPSMSTLSADRSFGRSWNGEIAEVVIYNDTLSNVDRTAVEQYLEDKWINGSILPPASPSGLTANAGVSFISLDWNDNSEGDLAGYTVYRSATSGSGYVELASGLTSSDYSDSQALPNTTYYYVVSALDDSGNESVMSSEASAQWVVLTDTDGDGVPDDSDAFPNDPDEWLDTDGDGTGNNEDTDDDDDGVADGSDAFPLDASESVDTDGDGIGNNADPDDDNDGVVDGSDAFPLDASESVDTDGDGIGNNADPDDDNDGVEDAQDAYPLDPTRWQVVSTTMEERQADYLSQKLGMFIHYNMSTYTAEEWAEQHAPNTFAPTDLDTDQWASVARSAGMKYGVLTAKHHDGFCLWDSAYTSYDVAGAGAVDVVQQYVDSFRAKGMKVGLYFSIWDKNRDTVTGTPTILDLQFAKDQIEELLTNYGHIDYLWFDGMHGYSGTPWHTVVAEIRTHIRTLSPNTLIMVNNDHNTSYNGYEGGTDISVYEVPLLPDSWYQAIVNDTAPAELADTAFDHWFWKDYSPSSVKPVADIVDKITKANDNYANFLLNVGPNKEGKIPGPLVTLLAEIGETSGIFDDQAPVAPFNPSPANGETDASIAPLIKWSNGGGADSYNVYLGTSSTLTEADLKGNISVLEYDAGLLESFTTYYLRIDAVNSTATTTGEAWSFTTGNTRKSSHIVTDRAGELSLEDPEIDLSSATATVSATGYGYAPASMIDGDLDSFMHTDNSSPSWGKVELQSDEYISWIKVFNRPLYNPSRLNNCKVKVLDAAGQVVWEDSATIQEASDSSVHHIAVNGGVGVKGRSVWIGLDAGEVNGEGDNYLTIAEVKLYGSAPTHTENHNVPFAWLESHGITVDDQVESVIEEDPDGDGYKTWEEYVIGSSPVLSNTNRLTRYEMDGSNIQIKFTSVSGRVYEVFSTDDLASGHWNLLQSNIPGTGEELQVPDAADSTNCFYRVRVRMAN